MEMGPRLCFQQNGGLGMESFTFEDVQSFCRSTHAKNERLELIGGAGKAKK